MLQGGAVEGHTSLSPRRMPSPLLEFQQMWMVRNSVPTGRHKSLSQIEHQDPRKAEWPNQSRRKLCRMSKPRAQGKAEWPNPGVEDLTENLESGEPTETRETIRKTLMTGVILI